MAVVSKICTKCKQDKELKEFNVRSNSKDKHTWECRECNRQRIKEHSLKDITRARARRKQWNEDNPEKYKKICQKMYIKHKARFKAQNLKTMYNLDYKEFLRIKGEQGNRCAVCGEMEIARYGGVRKELSVDHDHDTGIIRGLLCSKCNTAIGLLNENEELCMKVAAYLQRSKRVRIASA